MGFVSAVSNDWESVRKRRALMRLDENQAQVNEYLKRLDWRSTASELIQQLPSDLSSLCNTVWRLIGAGTDDSVPGPGTSEEVIISSLFRRPEAASLLEHTFNKVRKEIQSELIPADMKATVYVDQKLRAELSEALRSAFSSPKR
jgi:hypothetical protein